MLALGAGSFAAGAWHGYGIGRDSEDFNLAIQVKQKADGMRPDNAADLLSQHVR
jgi:hypothetical protein